MSRGSAVGDGASHTTPGPSYGNLMQSVEKLDGASNYSTWKLKNTHNHRFVGTPSWQRRSLSKNNNHVMKREIENIRNSFHMNNLKNQVILQRDINFNKLQKTLKACDISLNDIEDITELYLPGTNSHDELVVRCNDDFKLNVKPKYEQTASKSTKDKIKSTVFNQDIKTNIQEENCIDNKFIRIECKYMSQNNEIYDNIVCDESNDEDKIGTQCEPDTLKSLQTHDTKANLQSLLYMMPLSLKVSDNEERYNCSPKRSDINTKMDYLIIENTNNITPKSQPESEDIINILNVKPLRVYITERQIDILKKYTKKWKDYVHHRKEAIVQQRQAALDNFFEKLSIRKSDSTQPESVQKAKLQARDYSTYQHRYKIQKHIIALQKAKLEEQNRLIEELKYNKIVEASKQSVEDMREEIRKTYYEIDRQLKPKIKCLTNELKIHDIEEPALVLHCLKVPQFLQRMEKRAREREEKHAMIRERRRQLEEDRVRLKQQAELAKAEMDKEEKMKRILELREKRKRERIEAIRKKQHADRIRALIVMADLHYERYLMAKYCIRPFKKLLQKRRDNMEKAKALFTFQLKKNVFLNWMWYTEDMWFERNYKADDFRRKKILRKALDAWKQAQQEYIQKKQVADDYYDFYVMQLIFRHFRRGIEEVKKANELKLKKAVLYYNRNMQFKILTCWRTLPALNALKREQEARKARWREKVLQVVPDFVPPDD